MERVITGLHHITLVSGNYAINRRFYIDVLGLRQVKLSVNQDDIFNRHVFYANPEKTTGSTITFFEWPHLPSGYPGLGSPHHLAYMVGSIEALARWGSWLRSHGVRVSGPHMGDELVSIYLRDPDNTLIELAASREDASPEYVSDYINNMPPPQSISTDMRLLRFHHATPIVVDGSYTARFLEKFLGLEVKVGASLYAGSRDDIFLRYMVHADASLGFVGVGSIHHIALAVESEEDQKTIMRRLTAASIRHSGIVDRFWFKSLYFRDPDGNLMEIATAGPGYEVDEPRDRLGERLVLPPWLENRRHEIEARLAEQDAANQASWPPTYGDAPSNPESYEPANIR